MSGTPTTGARRSVAAQNPIVKRAGRAADINFQTLQPSKHNTKESPPSTPLKKNLELPRLYRLYKRSRILYTTMANPNAGHFFQTSESLVSGQRKAAKAKNKLGRPIKLSSKLLAVTPDPFDGRAVYVAEAAGEVRRVVLEVSFRPIMSVSG